MEKSEPTRQELIAEIHALKEQLCEAEQTIKAIQSGEVDAFVVDRPEGARLYTLSGADHGYRVLVESINEGALILSTDDSVYYCNRSFGEMVGLPIQKIVSKKLNSYVAPECHAQLLELIRDSRNSGDAKGELLMKRDGGIVLPVNVSLNSIRVQDFEGVCAVITDLSGQKRVEEELRKHRTELELLVNERTADLQYEIIERKRAEEEVRGQREWLRVTLAGIGDAVIATDASAKITFINPIAAELTGWREEEARGKAIQDVFRVINEKTGKPGEDIVGRVLRDGRIALLANNTALITRDGKEIPIEDSAAPIRDVAGNLIGVVLVFHNVSEKRRNLRTLHESEAKYRSLFENSLDGIFLTNPDGQVIAANPAACAMFQMSEEEFCQVGRQGLVDPSDPLLASALEERKRTGKVHQWEMKWVRKDGTSFPGEVSSVILEGGTKSFVIIRDISERKLAEDALRESEDMFRRFYENSMDGIMISSPEENRIIAANPQACRILGYTEEELLAIGRDAILDVSDPRLATMLDERDCNRIWCGELTYMRKDRTRFPGEISSALFHDRLGRKLSVIILRDVTERKQMEKELRKSRDELESRVRERTAELQVNNRALMEYASKLERLNEELQEFAFIASHDLQEPLRKIQTFGHMVVKKYQEGLDEQGRDYLIRITRAAKRMSDLLQSLLDYSRMATRSNPFEPANLAELAREVASDLEFAIEKAGGTVEIGDLPQVDVDAAQIRQLFQNLIANSMRYCKDCEKPVVRIHGHTSGTICSILVEDNGIGFEEEHLDLIFKPFQQLHGRGEYEGTGMGLTICRKIVERHEGSITAKSSPGQGATFIVQLPIKQREGEAE